MEHRCGKRCPLQLSVTLVTGTSGPLRAAVRNVSAGGMLVSGLEESLAPYEFVDIVLTLPGPATRIWRWPAMVVRSGGGSAALMFDRLRFGDLRRLLRSLRQDRLVPSLPVLLAPRNGRLPGTGQPYH